MGGLRVCRDEGPLALTANQNIFGSERVDRLAHRSLTHLIARGKFHLRRNRLARLPLARDQTLRQQDLNLIIERPETGAGNSDWHERVVASGNRLILHGC